MVSPVASSGISALSERLVEIQTMMESLNPAAKPVARTTSGERATLRAGSEFASILEGLRLDGSTSTATSGSIGDQVVELALSKLGTPYVYGAGRGANPTNFDCSGLTYWAYSQAGVKIGTWTGTQQHDGTRVADYHADGQPLTRAEVMVVARPGDLILMKGGDGSYASGYPGHVGIYIGNGQMVHAPKTGDVVKISDLAERSDTMYVQRIVDGPAGTLAGAATGGPSDGAGAALEALLGRLMGTTPAAYAQSRAVQSAYAPNPYTSNPYASNPYTPSPALASTRGGSW